MQNFDIHLCLVSAQAAPNFLPITDDEFKPKEAIFLVSNAMHKQAEFLEKAFQSKQVKVTKYFCNNAWDLKELNQVLLNIATDYADQNLAINLTGGTKLMTIAAQNVFDGEKPLFYFNDKNIMIINGDKTSNFNLNCKIKIKEYLMAYGQLHVDSQSNNIRQRFIDVADYITNHYYQLEESINIVNGYTTKCGLETHKVKLEPKDLHNDKLKDYLSYLHQQRLINFGGVSINFINEENRLFLAGGWLEDYTIHAVRQLQKKKDIIQDSLYNYKSIFGDTTLNYISNNSETDVIFMANNIMYIIECKTGKMKNQAYPILYKLGSRQKMGGIKTKVCLVSFKSLPEGALEYASHEHIKVIQAHALARLDEKLLEWINEK